MAYIRRKDRKIVGKSQLDNPESSALILKIKRGCNVKVKKKVLTFSFRGKLVSRPKQKKR